MSDDNFFGIGIFNTAFDIKSDEGGVKSLEICMNQELFINQRLEKSSDGIHHSNTWKIVLMVICITCNSLC